MNSCRIVLRLLSATAAAALLGAFLWADLGAGLAKAQTAETLDANNLSMQVEALKTLNNLKATPLQMRALLALADGTASKASREEADVSENYLKTLRNLRSALAKGDEDSIDALSDQLADLAQSEDPDLDDEVEVTEEARKVAPKALNLFHAPQVASHLANYGDDVPSPYRMLMRTSRLDAKGKKPTAAQWKEQRDETAKEVTRLLVGVDSAQAKKMNAELIALMDKGYAMKVSDKKARFALEKQFRGLTTKIGPIEVLRNLVESDLAQLLSNPQLPAAIKLRLPPTKAKK